LPPSWYKSPPYRARMVREPRAVLCEFGLELPDTTAIRIWDSSAEVRYIVLPMRPDGTEHLDEEGLADLVTRDCMVGVAVPQVTDGSPAPSAMARPHALRVQELDRVVQSRPY